jgi:hypothetical protein
MHPSRATPPHDHERVVLAYVPSKRWLCRCDCEAGTEKIIQASALRSGATRSCGCFAKERSSERFTTHGQSLPLTKLYRAWRGMKSRCTDPNRKEWKNYGGIGVTFTPAWEEFSVFAADILAAIGEPPTPKHSLDRYPNPAGNYEIGNVRWALPTEQANNKRRSHRLTWNGETRTITEWARLLNIPRDALWGRVRLGWTVTDIFTKPYGPHHGPPKLRT